MSNEERYTLAEAERLIADRQRFGDCARHGHAPSAVLWSFAGGPSASSCDCGRYRWTPAPVDAAPTWTPDSNR